MRDFFKQCLEDLEALTGNRQAYYFATDPDGTRKLKVCLDGMVLAAKDYPYIPEESQQKIIREQMVKDQSYEALNSRTVHKWLTAAANAYRTHSQFSEEDLMPRDKDGKIGEPAPPEVAAKYIAQFQANLVKIAKPVAPVEDFFKDVKRKESPHPSSTAIDHELKDLHTQYLAQKAAHDARGLGFITEEEFIKQHYELQGERN